MTTFAQFVAELEAEAQAQGPEAVAELEAFCLRFSLTRQLAEQRRARNLTQKQLAEITGINQAEISRIERRRRASPIRCKGYPFESGGLGLVPTEGQDYPGSYGELLAWFPDDHACIDYLEWLRWPDGFRCPRSARPWLRLRVERSPG